MSDLVYHMRTCAAALLASKEGGYPVHREVAIEHAIDLLVEASNLLEEPVDLGVPMEILEPVVVQDTAPQGAHWGGGDLPTRMFDFGAVNPKPCPSCGAIDVRKVRIEHNKLMLICPRCSHHWEYAR